MADSLTPTTETEEATSAFPIEDIPDGDLLYMRTHRAYWFPKGTLRPGVFCDHGASMSTDWERYSTPEETRSRGESSAPEDNAVISLPVGGIRAIPGQSVCHAPIPKNQAHTDVLGDKKLNNPETRLAYRRIHKVVIPLEDDVEPQAS